MIEELVPATVAAVATRTDLSTQLIAEENGPPRELRGCWSAGGGIVATAVVVAP